VVLGSASFVWDPIIRKRSFTRYSPGTAHCATSQTPFRRWNAAASDFSSGSCVTTCPRRHRVQSGPQWKLPASFAESTLHAAPASPR